MSNNKVGRYERTEENRRKISKSLKKYFDNPKVKKELSIRNSGTRNPRYGKPLSLESRKRMHEKMSGKKNPMWKHGEGERGYDYIFNNKFKNAIRKRDNQVCMLCGIHREKIKRALDVHHINYDSYLTIPENCIALCFPCHSKTNYNRKYWITFFQNLLSEKYGYKYENEFVIVDLEKEVK